MKRLTLILVTATVVFGLVLGVDAYLGALRRSTLKRVIGELQVLAEALEGYRCIHGSYPTTIAGDSFSAQSPAAGVVRRERESLAYFKDTTFNSYTLFFRYMGRSSFSGFELRDGHWVVWPDFFSAKDFTVAEQAITSARSCKH